jgi:hypothetical protein
MVGYEPEKKESKPKPQLVKKEEEKEKGLPSVEKRG